MLNSPFQRSRTSIECSQAIPPRPDAKRKTGLSRFALLLERIKKLLEINQKDLPYPRFEWYETLYLILFGFLVVLFFVILFRYHL